MKKLLWIALLTCGGLYAQGLIPSLSEPFAYPGSTINLIVSLVDSTPTSSITSIVFTPTLPAGVTMGVAIPASVTCPGGVCTATAIGNAYTSSIIATIPITVAASVPPGQLSITLSAVSGVNASGPVTIMAPNPTTLPVVASTGTTPWFSFSSGGVTCAAKKVAQLPIHVSFVCSDPYGGMSGSYTATGGAVGGQAGNNFTLSLNVLGATYNSAFCMISINSTATPIMIGNGLAVQPNSASYQCSGATATGPGSISWP